MRELDRTKKYNLVLLSKEQLKELFLELKKLKGWESVTFGFWSSEKNLIECLLVYCEKNDTWSMQIAEDKKGSDNALGLFYTLENVQVDCRELSEDQIKSMCNVYENNGYKIDDIFYKVEKDSYILSCNQAQTKFKQFGFYNNDDFDFISCNKFMELFSKEEKPLNEIKPQHYSKGIDTFKRMEENCTLEERLAFAKGNIDKYTWREKGQDKEDFVKIIKYAEWALKQLTND